jgi:hypothetical protein
MDNHQVVPVFLRVGIRPTILGTSLLVRHVGPPRIAQVPHCCRQGDTLGVLGVVGKSSLAVSIRY